MSEKTHYLVLSVADLRAMTRAAVKLAKQEKPSDQPPARIRRACVVIRNITTTDMNGASQISSWDVANVKNMSI